MTTHQCPGEGDGGLMPCYSMTPFDKPGDRITIDPSLVTCGPSSLHARVFEALCNARDSGYDALLKQSAYDIAADLTDCDADLEDENVDLVALEVTLWKEENHGYGR